MPGGIEPTVANYVSFVGFFYPIFIVLFLVIASIFNGTFLKGLIYLGGLGLSTIIWFISGSLAGGQTDNSNQPPPSSYCYILNYGAGTNSFINLDSLITFFTLTYLFIPMLESNQVNPYIITILLLGSFYNMYVQYSLGCLHSSTALIVGACIGILFGGLWFALFWATDNGKNRKFLFYDELFSNNVVCSKPKKQTFKCSVYKNGQLVSRNIV